MPNDVDKLTLASKVFSRPLTAFGDEVAECRKGDAVLPWPPMLPYVHPPYWATEPRIFYIGRDTYGWDLGGGGFSDFFDCYDAGDVASYLEKNAGALPFGQRATAWTGCTGSFWQVANLLHLRLRTGRITDTGRLSSEERAVLAEMGYGNLNSIEIPASLQKQECWNEIDQDKYHIIKAASEKYLDRYRLLLDAFSPHVSIILSWSGDEASYFEGLAYEKIADETEGKLKVAIYRVSNGRATSLVVWTYHPSYLPRIAVSNAEFVEKIATVVEKHKK